MTDGYKQPIASTYDARWNLCREIDEFGSPGSPTMVALLLYFTLSAWWGDKYQRKEQGFVDPKHGNQAAIRQYTGLSKGGISEALGFLEDDGWIKTGIKDGKFFLTVLLDASSRRSRINRRAKGEVRGRKTYRERRKNSTVEEKVRQSKDQFDSRTSGSNVELATVTDLRKHALRN